MSRKSEKLFQKTVEQECQEIKDTAGRLRLDAIDLGVKAAVLRDQLPMRTHEDLFEIELIADAIKTLATSVRLKAILKGS